MQQFILMRNVFFILVISMGIFGNVSCKKRKPEFLLETVKWRMEDRL